MKSKSRALFSVKGTQGWRIFLEIVATNLMDVNLTFVVLEKYKIWCQNDRGTWLFSIQFKVLLIVNLEMK